MEDLQGTVMEASEVSECNGHRFASDTAGCVALGSDDLSNYKSIVSLAHCLMLRHPFCFLPHIQATQHIYNNGLQASLFAERIRNFHCHE
jgi:hypothetical protein